jgi:hypothetical protein
MVLCSSLVSLVVDIPDPILLYQGISGVILEQSVVPGNT